jgi:methyl-accepting chemotaxis protein
MKLNNLKIGNRLALGFGLVLALLIAIVTVSYLRLGQIQHDMDVGLEAAERATTAAQWSDMTRLNLNRVMAIAKAGGQGPTEAYFTPLMKETTARISEIQKRVDAATDTDKGKALMKAIAEKRAAYLALRATLYEKLKQGDAAGADQLVKDGVLPASEAYLNAMSDLQRHEKDMAGARAAEGRAALAMAKVVLLVLLGVSVVLGAGMGWLITRSVTVPLREAVGAARLIAQSDLSQPLPESTRRDELGDLLRAVTQMQGALRGVVEQVAQATGNIGTASAEIATGSSDLSVRTEQTASSLQQAAASMEQLTATVEQSADSARQANQLAASAAAVAARGGDVVSQVVATMDDINSSSKKISDITGVIDGIAFQTNILALNAAVEAARAGEQGRGFAVVAGEVRNLAQRSAEAAKEIKALIGASVGKVEDGSRLVADAGKTMQEIVHSVQRVTDIIGEITAASTEQSDGLGQINTAVAQLDQMTQQNAALVEESAAAADSLQQQAVQLTRVVGTFKLGAAPRAAPAERLAKAVIQRARSADASSGEWQAF